MTHSLSGTTLRWTFSDGPTAGKTYEHSFRNDGTVTFHEVVEGKSAAADDGAGTQYASFELAPDIHLVSYRSNSGFTLTVAVDLKAGSCHGFASNETQWFPASGSVETRSS